jgi:hypothetical protein
MNLEERKSNYRAIIEQGKIPALFMQPWWLDATGSWDVSLAFRNDRLIGAMPYAVGRRWGIPYIGMPKLTQHLQIWMDKPPDIKEHKWLTREKQIIWSLIDFLPTYGFFSMVFAENSFDNWLPFYWRGFRQEMRYTFIIDHNDDNTFDPDINRNLKRNIRHATEEIRIVNEVNADAFYNLCQNTFKRQKLSMPYTFETFTRMDQAISIHHAGIKLGALNTEGMLVAVSYLLWDHNTAYYFLAGDNDEGRSSGASILLCHEALRIAFEEQKVRSFDFCGSMLEPISEIRRQFGARTVPLMKIFKAKYKWLDILYTITR